MTRTALERFIGDLIGFLVVIAVCGGMILLLASCSCPEKTHCGETFPNAAPRQ